MAQLVADYTLERLSQWGIQYIFGYPGDGISGLIGAVDRHLDKLAFIQPRHEEMAAFMACAYAKWTRRLGVCMATSGPGAIHLLNGLYDALKDHQPVLAIVGQQKRISLGADYQQEVDLPVLFKDVASQFCHMCTQPSQVRQLIDRAIRVALAERTVTCIIIPNDVQEMEAEPSPPREHGAVFTGVGYEAPRVVPRPEQLEQAARVLNDGKKVAMLVGAGALGATDEVMAASDRLGAGIAKALLGRAVVPDDLPFVTGSIGLLGTEPSDKMMQSCDTLFMVGTGFPYSEWLPKEGAARSVQIDIAPRMLSSRYPNEVSLCGDARETLRALLPLLEHKADRSFRKDIAGWLEHWWRLLEDRSGTPANPINPQRIFWELSPLLPDRCVLCADSGSVANWWARDLKIRADMLASLSGNLATMGCGVPYAIAAKFAHPDRPVIAAVGDGAMQMNGMAELITIAKYEQAWRNKQLVVLILNNRDLNQVTWEQRVMGGDPKTPSTQDLPDVPFDKVAELFGLRGLSMRTPDDVKPVLKEALSCDRPTVINAYVDPEVPPLPPHISWEQAKHFMSAVAGGDPHAGHLIRQSMKDLLKGFKPGQ
jgi:pyruvate dehydrogenase (quinone)